MRIFGRKNKSFHVSSTSYNIVNNFEETTIKECVKMDQLNESIYSKLLLKATKAQKNVRNSSIYMTIEVPPPPRPSNRDRITIWQKRTATRSVIDQSEAVLFLESKGLKYGIDYEAYQAIELSKEYKSQHNIKESSVDKSKQFDNIFTSSDTNMIRRKSLKNVNYIGLTRQTSEVYEPTPNYNFGEEPVSQEQHHVININTTIPSAPPQPQQQPQPLPRPPQHMYPQIEGYHF